MQSKRSGLTNSWITQMETGIHHVVTNAILTSTILCIIRPDVALASWDPLHFGTEFNWPLCGFDTNSFGVCTSACHALVPPFCPLPSILPSAHRLASHRHTADPSSSPTAGPPRTAAPPPAAAVTPPLSPPTPPSGLPTGPAPSRATVRDMTSTAASTSQRPSAPPPLPLQTASSRMQG